MAHKHEPNVRAWAELMTVVYGGWGRKTAPHPKKPNVTIDGQCSCGARLETTHRVNGKPTSAWIDELAQ